MGSTFSAEGRTSDSPGKDSPGRTRYRARTGGFVVAERDGRQQLYDLSLETSKSQRFVSATNPV